MQQLKASKEIVVRFNEVDSMNIVWHGSYALYFEDARAAFGEKYGLGYLDIYAAGYYAPLVDLSFTFKNPLLYGNKARVDIVFRNVEAAKIIFHYEIHAQDDNRLLTAGQSTQVFLDREYRLVWTNPPFYEQWKRKHHLL
ncbi:MAG: acyl-CoA thioesterase [Bacteroidales bacterium]|jgi:acyl-CoA thioester hydrolase|nr:acyl-CoA thioesterase [Bacteroidales bacterium]